MTKLLRALCLFTLLTTAGPATAEKYQVDPAHSSLNFTVEHLGLTEIDGRFTDFTGSFNFVPGTNEGSLEFIVQAKSINTDVEKRDEHLRSADFFDVTKYPLLSFKSTRVTHLAEERYQVDGKLTIHGVTKSITTSARIIGPKEAMGAQKIGFRTTFKINRLDFKVGDGEKFKSDAVIDHSIFIEVKGEANQIGGPEKKPAPETVEPTEKTEAPDQVEAPEKTEESAVPAEAPAENALSETE